MANTLLAVYKLKSRLLMQDPDMPGPNRFHTAMFVETHAAGPDTGTKHHVTGDLVQGMHYESKSYDLSEEADTLHSKEFIGHLSASAYPEQLDKVLGGIPAPSRQKAFNQRTMRTEPVKSWDPLTFYQPGETRQPLVKCTEWIEQRAIPTLIRKGMLVEASKHQTNV